MLRLVRHFVVIMTTIILFQVQGMIFMPALQQCLKTQL